MEIYLLVTLRTVKYNCKYEIKIVFNYFVVVWLQYFL